ncbi:MAG: type II toxin-antitoxin system RelE/ParE family toxin [Deltaproteobacteria bacterium]|nr:type II toxin-antitoxin system RelE/ParE family toxin [Deltaproteobacteria bacterium]
MGETRLRQVVAYVTRDGAAPFADWLRHLGDRRARNGIRVRIARLRLGNLGDYKSVGGGVLELRVDIGPGYRVYIGQDGPRFILLLSGGTKRTQTEDIRKAQEYWADYLGG